MQMDMGFVSSKKDRFKDWAGTTRAIADICFIFCVTAFVYTIAIDLDLLEMLYENSRKYERWELDEMITLSIFMVFSFAWFSFRRWQDLRDAMNRVASNQERLKRALREIKELRKIIPICASCKKIRDDDGYWHQLEIYIRRHGDIEFSHGVCPDCMKNYCKEPLP